MNTDTTALELTADDVTRIDTDRLYALERLAGWKPGQLRDEALNLETGDHVLYAALTTTYGALDLTVAAMRATADTIEANGRLARAELDRRRAALKPFTGYVS